MRPPPNKKTPIIQGGRFNSHAATAPRRSSVMRARSRAPRGDIEMQNAEFRRMQNAECRTTMI
jgi:hypothetical protein